MTAFTPPIADISFVLNEVAGLSEISRIPRFAEATPDMAEAILEQAGRLAAELIAPLNQAADKNGAVYENGVVRMPKGFPEAYREFREGGWNALPFDPDYGGAGMPWVVAMAVQELWQAACLSFGEGPLLNQGATELLQAHGSAAQKATYLHKMVAELPLEAAFEVAYQAF